MVVRNFQVRAPLDVHEWGCEIEFNLQTMPQMSPAHQWDDPTPTELHIWLPEHIEGAIMFLEKLKSVTDDLLTSYQARQRAERLAMPNVNKREMK